MSAGSRAAVGRRPRDDQELDAEKVAKPPPPQPDRRAPLSAASVLALQRTAGNAAVIARLKDDQERADTALDAIAQINGLLAAEVGKHASYNAAMQQLSMEGLSEHTSKEKRSLVRAATLVYLTVGSRATGDADTIKSKLVKMDMADLRIVMQRWFPVPADSKLPEAGRTSFPALGATKKEKKAWDPKGFADPAEHGAGKSFRYLVIALQNQAKDKNRAYKYMDFLESPGILENFMNSTSVIDEEHRGTYTPYGFIIRAPAENVEVASPKDVSIANQSKDIERETEQKYAQHGLPEPGELLSSMAAPRDPQNLRYNEVVVRGRTGAGIVKVTAFFVKTQGGALARPFDAGKKSTDKDRRAKDAYVSEKLMKEIRASAAALKVPIVFIDEDDPSQDKLEAYDEDRKKQEV